MGKKTKTGLGRSLIKDRFSKRAPRQHDSLLHTADLNDGSDWGRLNLQSVTEESSFQEFLSTAQLAGTEFQAEKLNINVVVSKPTHGVISKEELKAFEETKEQKKDLLRIPRRPTWDETTTPEQLQQAERDSFLEWRRQMAVLQDEEGLLMTPYEKNLDFWRQLWRVVERSDVVVQILDARNPLLFRCVDLEKYVKEINPLKKNLLLINKSDFLNDKQRQTWYNYFCSQGIDAIFFSALNAAEELATIEEDSSQKSSISENEEPSDGESEDEPSQAVADDQAKPVGSNQEKAIINAVQAKLTLHPNTAGGKAEPWRLYGRDDLIEFFSEQLANDEPRVTPGLVTIGLVGYPNVGKSSSINALMAGKKVSVSATPGKTKHFQTLYLTSKILLCDCPGLVFPSLVASKADMVLNGILPIDQLKDHTPSVALLCSLIPRQILEDRFSIMVYTSHDQTPTENVDPVEFLNAFAYSRGFMTQNGQPDNPRAARLILKEFVNGRLLYCKGPPESIQNEYHELQIKRQKPLPLPSIPAQRATRQANTVSSEDVDKVFFKKTPPKMHLQGVQKFGPIESTEDYQKEKGKPWKDHSVKRNKREKLRRIYHHLDLH